MIMSSRMGRAGHVASMGKEKCIYGSDDKARRREINHYEDPDVDGR
jgi:hypothetical protein